MLLTDVTFTKTKTGGDMVRIKFVLDDGTSTAAISWVDEVVQTLRYLKVPVQVDASVEVSEYQGSISCKLTSIDSVYDTVDVMKWYTKLDSRENGNKLVTTLKSVLSADAFALVVKMLNENGREISLAMAAQYGGYHDGVIGGLLNHLRKVVNYGKVAMHEYENTFTQKERDLFFIGLFLHDMGKLYELKDGAYWEESVVAHTTSGIWFLDKYKDEVIEKFGRLFYLELVAIISQHHGEFGERPKSVYSYLVHVVDLLDARVSGLQKRLDEEDESTTTYYFDNLKLTFNRFE